MLNAQKKIAIIIGTKAELIKCMPIMLELKNRGKEYYFIHTGQHPLKKACEEFNIKLPNFVLSKEPDMSTKFWSKVNKSSFIWLISMIYKIRKIVNKLNPDYVIYHGDTMSTSAAAIGSSRFLNSNKKWKNVHLEAGLRSGNLFEPFPEEISRQISDNFSDILLAVSDLSEKNLEKKKKRGQRIIKIGNTVIDSSIIVRERNKTGHKINNSKDFALINIHRHENLVNKKRMEKIVHILEGIKKEAIWPLHDNTEYFLKKYGLMERIKKMNNIKITSLANYPDFIYLISKCRYLITDGGSIQEESLVFKKPCIILRNQTERKEGLSTGINFLTQLNVGYTRKIINEIERKKIDVKNFKNPYGERGLSKKIVDLLTE